MRIWIAFFLATAAAGQQPPPPSHYEIHGTVTEVGTNAPVGEAQISVEMWKEKVHETMKTTADLQGAFHIALDQPGEYLVAAAKDGYTDDGKDPAGERASNRRRVSMDKDHPSASVEFRLARAGELRGLVLDEDTGKPLANFHLYPIGLLYYHGETSEIGGNRPVTGKEGRFASTGLRPGKYLVSVGPQTLVEEQLLAKFTEEDLEKVDRDYQGAYWPGGGGLDMALPVEVMPGAVTDVGTIKVRKVPYYRIHITLPAGDCREGEKVEISTENRQFIVAGGGGEAVCGKDFLLRNFAPGSYDLRLNAGDSAETRMRSTVPVDVVDKNLNVTATLAHGVTIEGRVLTADGSAKPPMDTIQVHMWSTGDLQFPDERAPATPDSDGKFHFPNRPVVRVRVWVTGLGPGFVVREWRYNGSQVVDNIVALNPNAPGHTLEMVVDDKPAALSGTVNDGDTPVARPHVVLIRWPASSEDVFLSAKNLDGDQNGQFHYTGLAPGEYRILAVSPETAYKLDEPHVLERLLSRAEKVELSPGNSQTLQVKVTDPSR